MPAKRTIALLTVPLFGAAALTLPSVAVSQASDTLATSASTGGKLQPPPTLQQGTQDGRTGKRTAQTASSRGRITSYTKP